MKALESLHFFLPELFLVCGAFIALAADLLVHNKKTIATLSLLTLAGALGLCFIPQTGHYLFGGLLVLDNFTHFFRILAISIMLISVLISWAYKEMNTLYEGEYYCLILFMTFALLLMASALNLLMIFLAIEFVSVLSYILTGFLKTDPKSKEAALKYFLFGSLATGVMLFGMSLLFGATGSLDLVVIGKILAGNHYLPITIFSLLLVITGLGFKISSVPFHMWAPDVYEAAPTPVSALLTVAPKALGFAVLIRFLGTFLWMESKWQPLMVLLSILTMTLGNLVAISQTNIKRLLGYSSIAQAGYMLIGIATFNSWGILGIMVYLTSYTLMNLGAFAVIIAVSNSLGTDDIQSYAGLSKRSPVLAGFFAVFLLSLAGIPPTAGFIAKLYLFSSAIEAKQVLLVIAAAINSVIAAFYYFKIIKLMYLSHATHEEPIKHAAPLTLALALLFAGTLFLGIYPAPFLQFAKSMLF